MILCDVLVIVEQRDNWPCHIMSDFAGLQNLLMTIKTFGSSEATTVTLMVVPYSDSADDAADHIYHNRAT